MSTHTHTQTHTDVQTAKWLQYSYYLQKTDQLLSSLLLISNVNVIIIFENVYIHFTKVICPKENVVILIAERSNKSETYIFLYR